MAVSMKDLDPAFHGVGQKAGIEIWQMENSRPVAIRRSEYGNFFSGESYLILQVTALKSGVFRYDIHYWLGKSTSENEADAAAFKAMELDAALGGRAVQYREVEGYETDKFLSYFKPCFIPIDGGASSGFKKAESGLRKGRLFLCKGRHTVRIKEVSFVRSSLNHDNIFVLDTESKIFQFNGVHSSIYERAKALDVVEYIKKTYHKTACEVAIIEDGKFVADADSGEFWSHFGGFAPLGKKVGGEDISELEATSGKLFCILDGHTKEIENSSLKREMLDTNKCYLLDCGLELFIWMGHNTTLDARKAAILVAKEFHAKQESPQLIYTTCVIEGFEPREFKSKFVVWPQTISIPISEDGRGKVAALLKQQGFNVKGLLKAAQPKEAFPSVLNSAGKLQVWRISFDSRKSLSLNEQGKFYSSDCYVVMYTYQGDQKEEYLLCSWLGHQSTKETEATTAEMVTELASSLKESAVQVHIFEGKEPTQFLTLFERMCTMKGDETTFLGDGVALFQIHKATPHNCQAIQVEAVATSLNSSACFILQMDTKVFTWYGKFSTLEEQESTEDMVQFLKPGASANALKEGSETELFWDALGGKKVYSSHRDAKEPAKDPRLFSCSYAKGHLRVTEVFNFTQDDLLSDEILILECFTEIFVWVGQHTTAGYKQKAFDIGQKYLEHAAAYEGISLKTPIYKITEGSEPVFFTSFFSWDSSKSLALSDPFKRKLSEITGQPIQSSKVMQSRNRSPAGIGERARLPRSSPARYSSFGAERSLQPRSTPSKQDTPRSNGKSSAVAALSSIFEVPNGGDSSPPFRKLSALCLATEEVKRAHSSLRTMSACPSPRAAASPRSSMIAALSSVFESFADKRPVFDSFVDKRRWTAASDGNSETASPTKQSEGNGNGITIANEEEGVSTSEGGVVAIEEGTWFPFERLKVSSKNPVAGIDYARRERYMAPEEFKEKFHMEKEVFYRLPKWKQDRYKLLLDLF